MVPTQAIIDAELLLARQSGLDFFCYDIYGFESYLSAPDFYIQAAISRPFLAHMASPNRLQMKFCFNVVCDWFVVPKAGTPWGYQVDYATMLRSYMDMPDYLRINGKPVLVLFDYGYTAPGGALGTDTFATHYPAIKAILGDCWIIVGDGVTASFSALGADAKLGYGPAGSSPGGSPGRYPYSAEQAVDISNSQANQTRKLRAMQLTPLQDKRPITVPGAIYSDWPAQDDWIALVQVILSLKPSIVLLCAWNELGEEGGGIVPTVQNGQQLLDGIKAARGLGKPATFEYPLGATTLYVTKVGAWTTSTNVTGAYDSEVTRSSTTSDTMSITRNMTGFRITGEKGPSLGIFSIIVDGGAPVNVDQYAASLTEQNTLYTSGALAFGSHTVTVTVTGTKNGSSSANTIAVDCFQVTYPP